MVTNNAKVPLTFQPCLGSMFIPSCWQLHFMDFLLKDSDWQRSHCLDTTDLWSERKCIAPVTSAHISLTKASHMTAANFQGMQKCSLIMGLAGGKPEGSVNSTNDYQNGTFMWDIFTCNTFTWDTSLGYSQMFQRSSNPPHQTDKYFYWFLCKLPFFIFLYANTNKCLYILSPLSTWVK